MSLYFADDDNITFGVQASNIAEAAQFSSTTDDVFVHLYTNNYQDLVENTAYGVAFGSSNFSAGVSPRNDFYIGNVTNNGTSVDRVITMRDTNVGIRTSVPQATLHVVGSNLGAGCNTFLVETINSPAYPALVINNLGYIGIGTTPTTTEALTVRGKLIVDNIQVGGGTGGGAGTTSSKLIVAYGMDHPADTTYLDFGFSTMSNISNIVTPLLQADNIRETIANIAGFTFIDNTITTVSAPNTRGEVTFTTKFNGNAPSYIYTLTTIKNGETVTSNVTNPAQVTINGAIDTIKSSPFSTGTYSVNIYATASNGTGTGSYFGKSNVATFTIGPTDLVPTPTVTLTQTPPISFTGSPTIIYSGIPYYTTGTQLTFPVGSIAFTNIYNTIDPVSTVPSALTLNGSNFSHASLFTNYLTNNASNTRVVSITIASNINIPFTLAATVYNINGSNTYRNFVPAITFVSNGINISETAISKTQYATAPIASVTRLSTSSAIPVVASFTAFNSAAPSQYDALFSPINSTFYSTYSAVQALFGTYTPSFTPVSGAHNQLTLELSTTAPLRAFVLSLTNAVGVTSVKVNWAGINTTWYDASIIYTQPTGCASATPTSTRFPIRLPLALMDQTLAVQSYIYVNIVFSGSVPMSGINIS